MTWLRRWFAAFCQQQQARQQATRHRATVAQAIWTGSTSHYTLVQDLPRQADSTQVEW